jgi:hypothetical protein
VRHTATITSDTNFTWATHNIYTGPTTVASSLGTAAWSWISANNTSCGGFSFQFDGWFEKESWHSYTIPEYPTDIAGLNLGTFTFFAPTGLAGGTVGQLEGANLVVTDQEPGAMKQGTFVKWLPHNVATTVFIEKSLLPAAGGTLYVGVQPNWIANYGGYTCGFRWPWMDGQGNSAECYVNYSLTPVWQTYDTGASEWGSAEDDDTSGAWWEGNLPWLITSSDAGSWGLDGEHLYLTCPAGSPDTLTATMYGTDEADIDDSVDDAVGEPWSLETGVAMKARFKLTTAGSLTETGARYLRFRWHDGRDLITGEARLGDQLYAQGILGYDGDGYTTTDNYVAKDITEGEYMWLMIDTRNPDYLRFKMWDEGDVLGYGEPGKADLLVSRNDDSENPDKRDYFELSMSAGNATGADQTIQVDRILFCGSGDDCEWTYEYIGSGDGTNFKFETSQPFKKGSLAFMVDGMDTPPVVLDTTKGQFASPNSIPAAQDANLTARYRIDRNPDGD